MDVAGPFLTTEGRGKAFKRRYLLLFNCLECRDVHFEALYSLEADSFLLAFERFIAIRGRPEFVLTDNGTNFTRGQREIRDLIKQARGDPRFKPIRWFFIPPLTPTWNGVSERLIQAAKRALRTIIGETPRTMEELHTAFAIGMGVLNNRPLTVPSDDPRDLTPITPNHFLIHSEYIPIGPTPINEWSFSKRWLETQKLGDALWNRFVSEFIPTLQGHRKWSSGGKELEKGDIVVMLDRKVRGKWGLGRIEETFPSPVDGRVRSFSVRDGATGHLFRRALHQVFRLDLDEGVLSPDLNDLEQISDEDDNGDQGIPCNQVRDSAKEPGEKEDQREEECDQKEEHVKVVSEEERQLCLPLTSYCV